MFSKKLAENVTAPPTEWSERSLREALELIERAQTKLAGAALPEQAGDIFTKYNLEIINDSTVTFTLPRGISYTDLYNDCNEYCAEPRDTRKHKAVYTGGYYMDNGVEVKGGPVYLYQQEAAIKAAEENITWSVYIAADTVNFIRSAQDTMLGRRNLSIASLEATTAAAALYYCLTGEDLLKGLLVWTSAPTHIVLGV